MENFGWLLLVGFGALLLQRLGTIARSLQNTEAMMHKLLDRVGVDWQVAVEPSDEVKALAANRKTRTAAIRAYREQTGLGVKEAVPVIDTLALRSRGPSDPADLRPGSPQSR